MQTVRSIGLISSRYGSLVVYAPRQGTQAHKRAGNGVCCGVNGHTLDSRLFLLCLPSPQWGGGKEIRSQESRLKRVLLNLTTSTVYRHTIIPLKGCVMGF